MANSKLEATRAVQRARAAEARKQRPNGRDLAASVDTEMEWKQKQEVAVYLIDSLAKHKADLQKTIIDQGDETRRCIGESTEPIRQLLDALAKPLANLHFELRREILGEIATLHRLVTCVRSDTLALMAMREANARQVSRVEALGQELIRVAQAAAEPKPTKKHKKDKRAIMAPAID